MIAQLAGWIAPAATMIAAVMTAANLGTRVTGFGFAIFAVGAVAWVVVGATSGQQNLVASNAFLFLVDVVGIWRWLGQRARYDQGADAARARSERQPVPSLFALGRLDGMAVRGRDGETIGTVVEAMASCGSGTIDYLVVREGGVGGVGERLHALAWADVTVGKDALECRLGAGELGARPALDPQDWPASARAAGA